MQVASALFFERFLPKQSQIYVTQGSGRKVETRQPHKIAVAKHAYYNAKFPFRANIYI